MCCFRLEDSRGSWWDRFVCWLRGHDIEVVEQIHHKMPEPGSNDLSPKPKPGVIYIEEFYLLHWISDIHVEILQCKRCQGVWQREKSCKGGPPKRLSQWAMMQVDGRVIVPPV